MRNTIVVIFNTLIFLIFIASCSQKLDDEEVLPNIVFILSDDQAWTDYSFMGHPHISTPYIDKLAQDGMTFTRGYVTAPVCSPSLASIITGLYPYQHGITGNDPIFEFKDDGTNNRIEWLRQRLIVYQDYVDQFKQKPTLPKLLQELGYRSMQTGKWWHGSWKDGGFTDGMTSGDPKRGGRHGDMGLKIGREGIDPISHFLDDVQTSAEPFFLWYAPFLPHTPHNPPDSILQKYVEVAPSISVAKYWAMCEWFDLTIGQLLEAIELRGMTENTLVVYVCDNGWIQNREGNGFKWPSKQAPYDYGIRTPIIYKWPGHIKPVLDTAHFVSSIDMVVTVLKAVGMKPEPNMQGIDVANPQELNERETIFAQDGHHDMIGIDRPGESLEHRIVLKNPWKLIVPVESVNAGEMESGGGGEFISVIRKMELYNVIQDPFEHNDLSNEKPEIVEQLLKELNKWWTGE